MTDKEMLQAMSELLDAKLEPIDKRLAKLEVLIESETNRNIQLLAEGYLPMADKMNEIADIVEDTKLTVDIIEKVVVKHSYDINKLKKSS